MKYVSEKFILKSAMALTLLIGGAVSCTKGGSVKSSGTGATSGTFSTSIELVYPTDQGATWTPITSDGRTYIKGLSITVTGKCSRGVSVVKVDEGSGAYTETANCSDAGKFTWNKTYTATTEEGDKTLTFSGYGADGSLLSGSTSTAKVRIDNTAPAAPVITAPTTSTYQHVASTADYTITGTVASDAATLTGPNSTSITVSSNAFTYPVTLVNASALNYGFYATDLAGNQSATTTVTITWNPALQVKVAGAILGKTVTDSSTSYKLEASAQQHAAKTTDSTSNFSLVYGFNPLVNVLRAQ